MASNQKKLDRLFAADPHCYWCGKLTHRITPNPGETTPDDMATFDHLIAGSNVARKVAIPRPGVLACYKCNQERGAEYQKSRRGLWRKNNT